MYKRVGKLTYNAGMPYEVDRMIKELPEDLEAYKAREMVMMKRDKAIDFFGIDFKQRGLFNHMKDLV